MTSEGTATASVRIVTGTVKWFDLDKGYGFITAQGVDKDIMLHANVLRNFGQNSVADGAVVTVQIQKTERGWQAVEVISIKLPEGAVASLSETISLPPGQLGATPLQPARVKWFDKGKGFGFINVFGQTEDVFIHIEVLRAAGQQDLQPGEAVVVRIIEGTRGRTAAQVLPWDQALPASKLVAAE
ncbi:MAG: hypothetical protein RLZZ70_249 [Candidatus Parcubacteria bacterium]|jgi:CspA family cold shock protein